MAKQSSARYIEYYTEGSAAKKVAPVIPVKKIVKPKAYKRKRRVIFVDPVAIVGILVAFSMLLFMISGVRQLLNAQQSAMQMEQYVEYLGAQNESLVKQYEDGYDIADIEKKALAMGMIPKDNASEVSIPTPPAQQQEEEEASLWQKISTFLTGLFA